MDVLDIWTHHTPYPFNQVGWLVLARAGCPQCCWLQRAACWPPAPLWVAGTLQWRVPPAIQPASLKHLVHAHLNHNPQMPKTYSFLVKYGFLWRAAFNAWQVRAVSCCAVLCCCRIPEDCVPPSFSSLSPLPFWL